jgi:hypothetical protein
MAYEQKMKETDRSVIEFIEAIDSVKKREDAYRLLELFEEVTGFEPKMWGPSIIGFGAYHYKYDSGHEGDAPLAGFSPRKAKISIYLEPAEENRQEMLRELGKHTSGASCVYVNKLADIDLDVLKRMIVASLRYTQAKYPPQG